MSDEHLNPYDPATEAETPTAPAETVDSFIMPAGVISTNDTIHRPAAPSPEKLKQYFDRLHEPMIPEDEVMRLATTSIPDYDAQDRELAEMEETKAAAPLPPQDLNPLAPAYQHLGIQDGAAAINNDPRFDTEAPMHDPKDAREILDAVNLSGEELTGPKVQTMQKIKPLQMNPVKKTPPATPLENLLTEAEIAHSVSFDGAAPMVEFETTPPPTQVEEPIIEKPIEETKGIEVGLQTNVDETTSGQSFEVEPIETPEPPIEPAAKELETATTVAEQDDAEEQTAAPDIPTNEPVELTTTDSPHQETANMVEHLIGEGGGQEFVNALNEIPTVIKDHQVEDDLINVRPDQVTQEGDDERMLNIDDAMDLVIETTGSMLFERDFTVYPDLKDLKASRTDPNNGSLVIPLMNAEVLNELCIQTDPRLLEATNTRIFGKDAADIKQQLTQKNIETQAIINDPTSYLYRIHAAREFFSTENSEFQKDILKTAFTKHKETTGKDLIMGRAAKVRDNENETTVIVDDKLSDKSVFMSKLKDNSVISGPVAFKAASMLINGLRRINLYNSGFFIVICAPRLDQLTRYANAVRTNAGDYGRVLGKLAFIPAGVEIRAALFDLIEAITVDSNLTDFNQPGVLRSAISSLDYNTLIWGAASLMYPRGVEIEYVCYNDGKDGKPCHRIEKAKIDVGNMRYNNWSLLNAEAILFVDNKKKRTVEEARAYREKYLQDTEVAVPISEDGSWVAHVSIPTVAEAEESQRAYVAELLTAVQIDRPEHINQYIRAKYLNSFVPYVRKITYKDIDPESGEKKHVIFKDAAALANALDNLQLAPGITLGDKIVDFIAEKTVTHVCFAYHPCPKCGNYPKDAVNRLIACDPEFAFFQWAISQLQ